MYKRKMSKGCDGVGRPGIREAHTAQGKDTIFPQKETYRPGARYVATSAKWVDQMRKWSSPICGWRKTHGFRLTGE